MTVKPKRLVCENSCSSPKQCCHDTGSNWPDRLGSRVAHLTLFFEAGTGCPVTSVSIAQPLIQEQQLSGPHLYGTETLCPPPRPQRKVVLRHALHHIGTHWPKQCSRDWP